MSSLQQVAILMLSLILIQFTWAQDGTIVLDGGVEIQFTSIDASYGVKGNVGEISVRYPFKNLAHVILNRNDGSNITSVDAIAVDGKSVTIENPIIYRYGRPHPNREEQDNALAPSDIIPYALLDPLLDQKIRNAQALSRIEEIRITGGNFAMNPTSGRLYPADYKYDPYDGTRLTTTKVVGQASPAASRCCPSCRQTMATGRCSSCGISTAVPRIEIASKPIDYFIERAGFEAQSDEATAAKRYVWAWMNPFSSEDEIIARLKELVGNDKR